jgi:uncharacterized protein YndB with AHSA1/START domain
MSDKLFAFEMKYIVYAKPSDVYHALTFSPILEKWMEGRSTFELRIGGSIELFDGWVSGTVTDFKKDEHFTYTWKPTTWNKKAQASIVTFEFESDKAGTQITIKHTGFPSQQEANSHKEGWITYVLDPLNDYFISKM